MPTITLPASPSLTSVTILPDLTPEELAIAMINDTPDDFMRGMTVYKIEALPCSRLGEISSIKHELKYAFRKQVPGVWLADLKDDGAFAAGIPPGIECPVKTQMGRYTVTKLAKERPPDGIKYKIAVGIGKVLARSKNAVFDLRDSVAFRCGFRQVQEIEIATIRR